MTRRSRPPVVLRDALDEADFEGVLRDSHALSGLVERGSRLLPDFRELVGDLYCACVKLVVETAPAAELPPSARLRARLVETVLEAEAYHRLRSISELRPARAGLAALRLGERALAELKAQRLLLERELRDVWEADAREEEISRLREEAESARLLAEARGEEDPVGRIAEAEADALEEEAEAEEVALGELADRLVQAAEGVPPESLNRLRGELQRLPESLAELASGESELGLPEDVGEGGGGGGVDALELGERLARNKLLQRLARLVGALRFEAQAARRKRVPRARTEVYGIEPGGDLARLLPVELVALRHPVLRRDWRRRFLERELLTYRVRGDDEEGRGPAVICLDVSGSMSGRKSIWAKAVAMTLAELARRDGRAVTVLTFSAGPGSVGHHELVPDRRGRAGRPAVGREALLSFVETRVGGGTDFAPPLAEARAIIRESRRHRRGDIVLITDGEAQLGAARVAELEAFKRETDSRCIGVLIDVADHRTETLRRICDEIASIRALTVEGARRVFEAFDRS